MTFFYVKGPFDPFQSTGHPFFLASFSFKLYRRRLFLEELGKSLITPKIQRRVRPARSPIAGAVIEKVKSAPSNQSAMDPVWWQDYKHFGAGV